MQPHFALIELVFMECSHAQQISADFTCLSDQKNEYIDIGICNLGWMKK